MAHQDKKLGRYRKGVVPLHQLERYMIVAKYKGKCYACGGPIERGTNIMYSPKEKISEHVNCAQSARERKKKK